jgi:hypothetical protein
MIKTLCLCLLAFLPAIACAQETNTAPNPLEADFHSDTTLEGVPHLVKHLQMHGLFISATGNIHIRLYHGKTVTFLDDTITAAQLKTYDRFDWNYDFNPIVSATEMASEVIGFAQTHPVDKPMPIAGIGAFLQGLHEAVIQ